METVLMYTIGLPAMAGIAAYYVYLIVRGVRHLFFSLLLRRGGMQGGLLVLRDNAEVFEELGRQWSERG